MSASAAQPPTGHVTVRRCGRERVYFGLLAAGIALPYAQALPWVAEYGFDVRQFARELFGTRMSSFFGWDVITSVATLLALTALDELPPSARAAGAAGSTAGASVGLPLYLLLRERQRRLGVRGVAVG